MNYEITYSTVFLREKIKEIYVLDNVFTRENKRRDHGGEDAFTNREK